MAKKDDKGRWIDASGQPVPPKYIDPVAKKRDALVEKLFRQALQAQERLRKFKELVNADIEKYLDWLAKHEGEESLNPGGNYKLTTFSGDKRVQVKINKVIDFDERLQLAKQKIDRCIERWSEGANDNLKVIIFDAFKVDSRGRLDARRILSLRNLQIKDAEWQAAMDLITEAVTIIGTRSYLLFLYRDNPRSEWQTVRLDLAGV